MYSWQWSLACMFGLHWLCPAQWNVMGGRATCNCDKDDTKHRWEHTGTHKPARRLENGVPVPGTERNYWEL